MQFIHIAVCSDQFSFHIISQVYYYFIFYRHCIGGYQPLPRVISLWARHRAGLQEQESVWKP